MFQNVIKVKNPQQDYLPVLTQDLLFMQRKDNTRTFSLKSEVFRQFVK